MNDPGQLLKPEEKLLLSLCRLDFSEGQKSEIRELMKKVGDWDHFVKLSNDLGIIALCWWNISETGNSQNIPSQNLEVLHKAYLKSMTFNAFLYNQLKEIAAYAKKEDIKIVILKGLALEKTIYGNQGIRQISDIDILVENDKALPLRRLLSERGFVSAPLISPLHEGILPYLKSHLPSMVRNGASVEIHVSLFDQEDNSLTEKLFNDAYLIADDDIEIFYPPLQMFFIYLVKHISRHEKTKELQLKSFTDLVLLLSLYPDQILNRQLFNLGAMAGLTIVLSEKLRLLEIFWNFSFPDWVKELTGKVDSETISKKFISFIRDPENYSAGEQTDVLLKPLRKIPGLFHKILFIVGYVFPSLSYMKYKYNLQTSKKALVYYPVRWTRQIGKLLKMTKA